MRKSRGFSPVIATVVLAAVVLAIGGSVWYYAIGASTVIANSYVNETLDGLYEVTERFIIEQIYYDSENSQMQIWVYNYGKMKIAVGIELSVEDSLIYPPPPPFIKLFEDIEAESMEQIIIEISLESGDNVSVRLYSTRENNVYATYYVP